MKPKAFNLIWGLILILGGGLFLAQNLGYIKESPQLWMAIFGALSLLFFASYFLNGIQQWGWLFPACIAGALALTIALAQANGDATIVGLPVLLSISLPFLVAFALAPRQRGWALIPVWVMIAISLVTLISERVAGELIGMVVLLAIALPFLATFLFNRARRWALIPALILGAVSLIPPMPLYFREETLGGMITLVVALPFLVIYLFVPGAWWALIPGGVMASVAVGLIAMSAAGNFGLEAGALMTGLMFLGWAAIFLVLWLRRKSLPTGWAKYPALGLLVIALIMFLAGTGVEIFWPVALIIAGALVLISNFRPKRQG